MKKYLLISFLLLGFLSLKAQSCSEILNFVKSKSYGQTYSSYSSDAIRSVTFYDITDDNYNHYYFAIVQFTSSWTEYIYQVDSSTKWNYSMYYLESAGKAFWNYIEPYSNVLGCSPKF